MPPHTPGIPILAPPAEESPVLPGPPPAAGDPYKHEMLARTLRTAPRRADVSSGLITGMVEDGGSTPSFRLPLRCLLKGGEVALSMRSSPQSSTCSSASALGGRCSRASACQSLLPTDDIAHHRGGTQVGRLDLEELRDAADEARRWDPNMRVGTGGRTPSRPAWNSRLSRCCQARSPTSPAASCSPSAPNSPSWPAGRPSTSGSMRWPSGTSSRPSASSARAGTSSSAAMS